MYKRQLLEVFFEQTDVHQNDRQRVFDFVRKRPRQRTEFVVFATHFFKRIFGRQGFDNLGSTTWKGIQFTGQSILQLVFGNPTRKRGSNGNPRLRVGLPF